MYEETLGHIGLVSFSKRLTEQTNKQTKYVRQVSKAKKDNCYTVKNHQLRIPVEWG